MGLHNKTYRFIISGGGTGGHIFPAISIANALREQVPGCTILFVGALGKMEMERIPQAGYEIIGLPVAGLQRSLSLKNLSFPFKLMKSLREAKRILKNFRPDAVIGVGGYASGPIVFMAQLAGLPTFLQEQNSYPGITNKILSKKVKGAYVAYHGLEKFFPKDKILVTGNPVRKDLFENPVDAHTAKSFFGLSAEKPILLILGGSLGAATVNKSMEKWAGELLNSGLQIIWQTGKGGYEKALKIKEDLGTEQPLFVAPFIKEMKMAYAAADLVVSRAGAGTISELATVRKPSILIPSPNVAEDHQTANARALVEKNAAWMLADANAVAEFGPMVLKLAGDPETCAGMKENLSFFDKRNAADVIVNHIIETL